MKKYLTIIISLLSLMMYGQSIVCSQDVLNKKTSLVLGYKLTRDLSAHVYINHLKGFKISYSGYTNPIYGVSLRSDKFNFRQYLFSFHMGFQPTQHLLLGLYTGKKQLGFEFGINL